MMKNLRRGSAVEKNSTLAGGAVAAQGGAAAAAQGGARGRRGRGGRQRSDTVDSDESDEAPVTEGDVDDIMQKIFERRDFEHRVFTILQDDLQFVKLEVHSLLRLIGNVT